MGKKEVLDKIMTEIQIIPMLRDAKRIRRAEAHLTVLVSIAHSKGIDDPFKGMNV